MSYDATKDYVLFSPIGDTDPVRGGYDGPMLHIVRHWKPRMVYLYLTASMSAIDKEKNFYEEAIHYLNADCRVKKFHTDIENAHDFDAFYEHFDQYITQISDANPNSTILMNVSSGTPQINSTVCLEFVSRSLPLVLVQVSNPENKSGRDTKHFDVRSSTLKDLKDELENLYDTLPEAKYRCLEPTILAFKKNALKNQINALISNYDYQAAYHLMSKNGTLFGYGVKNYLEHAYYRSMPDNKRAHEIACKMGIIQELYPLVDAKMYEYYLNMKIKSLRREISDFLLRLKPFAEHLAGKFLDDNNTGWKTVAKKDNKRDEWYIDEEIAEKNHRGLIAFLNDKYYPRGLDMKKSISNLSTMIYIMEFKQLDPESIETFQVVNSFTEKRNEAAHSLESVTEDDFRELGTTSKELCEKLEALIRKLYKNIGKGDIFNMYEQINKRIIEEMNR